MSSNKRSTRPRRTEEMQLKEPVSSAKKSVRLSRIAQPIRKSIKVPQENIRSASSDRFSYGPNPSAAKPRSTSATPLRHSIRTPMRTPLQTRSKTPNGENIMATCEKSKPPIDDKEWLQNQNARICEYMCQVEGLSRDFVQRGNLKAMSTKQFVIIVSHSFRQIGANRYKIGTNYVDDIAKHLGELEYPYTFNKSMLKTPNAPHSINNIIALMSWLLDLIPAATSDEERKYFVADDFPNIAYMKHFYNNTKQGFNFWNNKQENEFEDIKCELSNDMVILKTGLGLKELQSAVVTMENEFEDLNKKKTTSSLNKQFTELEKQVSHLKKMKKNLTESCKTKEKQMQKIASLSEQYSHRFKDLENMLIESKTAINRQKMSVKDRDELSKIISYKKDLLNSKKTSIKELQCMSSEKQIQISRLIKEKINAISKLNNYLYKLSHDMKGIIEIDVSPLQIKLENDHQVQIDLENLSLRLSDINQIHSELFRQYLDEKTLLDNLISDMKRKNVCAEDTINDLSGKFSVLEQERETINNEIAQKLTETTRQIQLLRNKSDGLAKATVVLQEQLNTNIMTVKYLKQEKQELMDKSMEECERIMKQNREKHHKLLALVKECEKVFKKFDQQ